MKLTVELPRADTMLRNELQSLGFYQVAEREGFEGADVVRVSLEVAAVAGAIAATMRSASATAKSAVELIETLKVLFGRSFERYKKDPNADFIVLMDDELLLASHMSDEDCQRALDILAKPYDRSRSHS